jgi:monofunctional glycosyltransferase
LSEPAIEITDEGPDMARRPTGGRAVLRRWNVRSALRSALLVLLVLAMLPVALTVLYRPSAVHPVSTLMLKDLATAQGYDRRWVPLESIAPVMVNSVIMSEDGQFCFHYGIDLREMQGVITDALAGESTRGASTIPMQTVKNLFLWQGRSFLRKALEAPYAVYADLILPKRRIMEIYLNIAEWGPNIYGIEAAAQHHFGRSAANLTPRQAALLAVTLPNPYERDPAKPGRDMRALAERVQRLAARSGAYVGCVK